MTERDTGAFPVPVNTTNDFGLMAGQNLPNHSASMRNRAKFVRQIRMDVPQFRDRQTAYRYAAYLITLAEMLPNEDGCDGHTFAEVLNAVQNA